MKRRKSKKTKVIMLNMSKVLIGIIIICILTVIMIKTKVATKAVETEESESTETEDTYTWVESTELDEEGNAKKVPVPKGYTASQIEGETTVSGGFVIYEGEIDWSKIIIKSDETSEGSSDSAGEEKSETEIETTSEETENNEETEDTTTEDNTDEIDDTTTEESEIATVDETVTEEESDETEPTAEEQTRANIFELQSTVNQWVWVPVEDISEIYGIDENGRIWGKLYSFSYSGRSASNWTEENGKMIIKNKTGFREPDVLQSSDIDSSLQSSMNGITRYEFLEEMQQNYYAMLKSIENYGGFYIGRYETGGLSGTAVIQKMNTDIGCQTWNVNWNTMYQTCKNLNGTNENVMTSMIWGSLWDATLEWFVDSGATNSNGEQVTYSLVGSNSTSWGNYNNATFEYIPEGGDGTTTITKEVSTTTRIPAGSSDYTKVNNIYDMAGNVWEKTIEANVMYARIGRSGSCNDSRH